MNETITCLGNNTEKYFTFSVQIEKEVTKTDKKGNKITKPYLTDYDLLIIQDLYEAYYQILLTILLKEFIKLNINTDTMIRNLKLSEFDIKTATGFLNIQTLKII